jgi:hypothetical protein
MTLQDFTATLEQSEPPTSLPPLLLALWHDANDDWEKAHDIAQSREGTPDYDRLHAYLHRKEGDQWNAGYWYRRAGAPVFNGALEAEWQALAKQFLPTS